MDQIIKLFLAHILIILGVLMLISRIIFLFRSSISEGVIKDFDQIFHGSRTTYSPIIEFKVQNELYLFKSNYSMGIDFEERLRQIGNKISIRYIKSNPKKASINSFSALWMHIIIDFIIAIPIYLVFGILLAN